MHSSNYCILNLMVLKSTSISPPPTYGILVLLMDTDSRGSGLPFNAENIIAATYLMFSELALCWCSSAFAVSCIPWESPG